MKSKHITKKAIVVIVCLVALLSGVVGVRLFRDFDAQGYCRAVLNQTFRGEVSELFTFIEDKNEEELLKQYEEGIQAFTDNNVTYGVTMEDAMKEKYTEVCRQIFKEMKYEVQEAEKINRKEYHVPVKYQSSDVLQKFMESIQLEYNRLLEKVDQGEYEGTEEEIKTQMQTEILENCYEFLKTAYQEMEYKQPETMIFIVKKNAEGLFVIEEERLQEFVIKIMGLDEI